MITVKQLIEQLQKYDEEKEVAVIVDGRVVYIDRLEKQMIKTCPACLSNILAVVTKRED